MIVFYVLIGIVVIAVAVVGFMFFLLNKETKKAETEKVEPVGAVEDKIVVPAPSLEELEYKKKVEELEVELKEISDRGTSQASEAMSLIDQLTKENQALKMEKMQSQESNESLIEAQRQTDQLRQDNFMLSNQLQQASQKVEELQQENVALQQKLGEDLRQSHLTIEALKAEKEDIIVNRESSGHSAQTLNRELEEARTQVLALHQEINTLRDSNEQLKVSNENMFNQTQMFQQELMRQRAQISGLERICENYRIQVEEKAAS